MTRIFISYRRDDSRAFTERIYDHLVSAFGARNVFKDVDVIPLGVNFADYIAGEIQQCDVVIVVIGPDWADIRDEHGDRRLDNHGDFVRLEVEAALAHVPIVIPVLADATPMPRASDLPESLSSIPQLNAAVLHYDPYFHGDMDRLIAAIRQSVRSTTSGAVPRPTRSGRVLGAIGVAAALLILVVVVLLSGVLNGGHDGGDANDQDRTPGAVAQGPESTDTPTVKPPDTSEPTLTGTLTSASTLTPTLPLTPSITPNMTLTFDAEFAARLTATAAIWTEIPSPTATNTPEPTATETPRPTNTPEPTATQTPRPTDTSAPTFTPTAQLTKTPLPRPDRVDLVVDTEHPEDSFFPAGSPNTAWTPVERDFDGVMMVLVPAGCFMMGSEDGGADERPVHQVCFDVPFWIDKTEVTNAQYGSEGYFSGSDRPREFVTGRDARDFCESRRGRLPTEAEWEYSARGPEGWTYPWGNVFVADYVVYDENSGDQTAGVGSRPEGASWVGALDMSGNVKEFVGDWYDASYYTAVPDRVVSPSGPETGYFRALRGGSFGVIEANLRAAKRFQDHAGMGVYNDVGFRCAFPFED